MGTKYPKVEKSDDQIVWSSEELSGQPKSYSCSFCQKGFSNAQALGGHMNIHRKDRAKLREFSEENMLSLGIVKKTNSPDDPSQVSGIMVLESSEEKSSGTPRRLRRLSREDDAASASIASPSNQLDPIKTTNENEVSSLQTTIHGSSTSELIDLELRLGPEPHQDQPRSRNNTKDFF